MLLMRINLWKRKIKIKREIEKLSFSRIEENIFSKVSCFLINIWTSIFWKNTFLDFWWLWISVFKGVLQILDFGPGKVSNFGQLKLQGRLFIHTEKNLQVSFEKWDMFFLKVLKSEKLIWSSFVLLNGSNYQERSSEILTLS